MSPSALHASASASASRLDVSPAVLRTLLVAGCLLAAAAAAWLGQSSASAAAGFDAELARLLRGMALIKGGIVLAAVGVLLWRFGRPLAPAAAAAYLAGAWLTAGASILVWQLCFIAIAALAFHVGEFTLLIVAWRDRGSAAAIASPKRRQHVSTTTRPLPAGTA